MSFFSSSPAATQRTWQFYSDDADSEESAVYKHALKFQQPSTVQIKPQIHNSVSFIGMVNCPFRRVNTADGSLGVHTWLNVSTTSGAGKSAVMNSVIGHPALPTGEGGATRAPICVELKRDSSLSSKLIVLQIDNKSQEVSASEPPFLHCESSFRN